MKAVAALVLAATGVQATGWFHAPPFNCPGKNPPVCPPDLKKGYTFEDTKLGSFKEYKDMEWDLWEAFDDSKRDRLGRRTGGKHIVAECDKDKKPSFGCKTCDKFDVDEYHVKPEFDCDLDFHYEMPDKKICKQRHACSSKGSVIKNTQCGGAKKVTVVYPPKPKLPKCKVTMSKIRFSCTSTTTSASRTSSATTTTRATTVVTTTQATTTTRATTLSTTSRGSSSSSAPTTSSAATTSQGTTSSAGSSATTSATTSAVTSATTSVVSSGTTSASSSGSSVTTSSAGSSATTSATTSGASSGTTSASSGSSSATTSAGSSSQSTSSASQTTSAGTTSGVVTTSNSPGSSSSGTTTTGGVSTTSEGPSPPKETLPCPEVVPSCLNTFLFTVGCKDNTDHGCFCPDKVFVQNVFTCFYAHGQSDTIVNEAIIYFQGLCAPYGDKNPEVVGPTITSYITPTATPTVPGATYTTVIVTKTQVVDCTGPAGEPSTTTTVVPVTATVPQVGITSSGPSGTDVVVVPVPVLTTAEPIGTANPNPNPVPVPSTPATAKPTGTGGLPAPSSTSKPIVVSGAGKTTFSLGVFALVAAFML